MPAMPLAELTDRDLLQRLGHTLMERGVASIAISPFAERPAAYYDEVLQRLTELRERVAELEGNPWAALPDATLAVIEENLGFWGDPSLKLWNEVKAEMARRKGDKGDGV